MNILKWLRENSNLTLRDLSKYTHISVAVLQRLETGIRPLKERQVTELMNFFWVTSDFLIGKTNFGIYAMCSEAEPITMSIEQYTQAYPHLKVTVLSSMNGDGTTSYCIKRDLDQSYAPEHQGWMDKAIDDLKKMDADQLQKTIRFMEDYILK